MLMRKGRSLTIPSGNENKQPEADIPMLSAIEEKVRWLSTWIIHHANHIRPSRDGIKVGGHQASCASLSTLMTALYFGILRPEDRVAVKPHASPVLHAIQYLFGNQSWEKLEAFRGFGGAQSYPSRTKDGSFVDFSTGSVGLGAAITNFSAIVQDYLHARNLQLGDAPLGRMIALIGDAELDEGNVYEALLDTWKHDARNIWWIIDYNRQSLDGMVNEHLFRIIGRFFRAVGWNVITLKYGRRLYEAFREPGGIALKRWINDCPNDIYSALTFQSGAAWRREIKADRPNDEALHALIDQYNDEGLHDLMTDLGGHCLEAIFDAFQSVPNDKPTIFICYTIKGHGLPLQGHKDNHAGLMNPSQLATYRKSLNIPEGEEWEPAAGVKAEHNAFLAAISKSAERLKPKSHQVAPRIDLPDRLETGGAAKTSTQESFGRILHDLAKGDSELARRIVTTSPDVTVSTNLGGWVNQRGLFHRLERDDIFQRRRVPSTQKWSRSPKGQHVELGIAENNLFLNLAAFGLSHKLFGERLFPIGTLYDPFIARGLDALNYGCYQDARFLLVATPSGITLAPEGGAHQSISAPLISIGQPGLTGFEPAYADELAEIMLWAFHHMQDEENGGSVYLRLSTRPLSQPERTLDPGTRQDVCLGGYWRQKPAKAAKLAIVYSGVVAPEAEAAHQALAKRFPGAGLLAVTSPDRLYNDWQDAVRPDQSPSTAPHIETLLAPLAREATIVTVLDGHPATLAWLGAVKGQKVVPLGINSFGQCGDTVDLYNHYQIDEAAICKAAESLPQSHKSGEKK